MPPVLPPPPLLEEPPVRRRPLSRREQIVAGAIFSGLAVVLTIAGAVMVDPSLIDDFNPFWPALMGIGFLSTVGGFWWLWWRPRG